VTNRWSPGSPSHFLELVSNFLGAPRFAAALTNTIIGTGLASLFLRDLIGWPGLIGIVTALVVLASLSMFASRHAIEWHGLLPISLLVFVAWVAVSVFWSQYQWATSGSVLYFAAFTMLGIYIGLLRDTIQIARAFGDVLRVALGLALGLEILSGILLDSPFGFLQIEGNLAELGPIQGIWGDRNQLAVIALLAMVTFATELRTRSVRRPVSATSLGLAVVMLVLSRSPIGYGALAVLTVMTAALLGLRRLRNENKRYWQFGLLAVAIAVGAVSWAFRVSVINALSASGELSARLRIWRQIRLLIPSHELEGWGWVGLWRTDVEPYRTLLLLTDRDPASGFNAFLDVWFQLGIVGLIIFVGLVGLTFIRSWLLASKQRSIVYAWPALTLVVLILTALAESSLLVEFGWLTFVVCSVKAARELSWRKAFVEAAPPTA
jgi:O-antigen ligase